MSQKEFSQFISYIGSAISSCSLYSEAHPMVAECAEKALGVLDDLYRNDMASFTLIGDGVLVNDMPLTERGTHIIGLVKRLKKKKLEKIVFRRGVDLAELKRFIVAMARADSVPSSPHISVGIVEVRLRTEGEGLDASALLDSGIARVKDAYQGIERFRSLDVVGLEEAVADFISTLKKEVNVLRIISPVKSYNEYTFVHAANVSVLTIFQAEFLGLSGEVLHDIGIAGLLHDVGKMFVPREVLDKRSTLDMGEWFEIKMHPLRGALYLSKLPDIPPLAVITAFEHHMKFDGSGYPQTKRNGRKPHIVSQMLAISDFFDALRTERPYRRSLDAAAIFELIRNGAGKEFNPVLADNFLTAVGNIT
jgi:HD-GYP domain-containing protein (c-di-GMP phosphodiesterase class II)